MIDALSFHHYCMNYRRHPRTHARTHTHTHARTHHACAVLRQKSSDESLVHGDGVETRDTIHVTTPTKEAFGGRIGIYLSLGSVPVHTRSRV